jgi:signal transduction histidine kinase
VIEATGWLLVLALTAGCAAVITAVGAGVLLLLRRRSMISLLSVDALVALGVVAAAVALTARAMFVSGRDLWIVLAVVLVATPAGTGVALMVGRWVGAGSRELAAGARAIGGAGYRPGARPRTAELTAIARELDIAHRRLVEARERERALEASRRQLVAWVSHDLRTPLAGLRAMTEALEDGMVADPATVSRYHRRIRAEVDRLSGMVGDLFELSRIQGSLRLQMQRISLEDLVEEALGSADPLARAKGVRLDHQVQPGVPVQVDVAELGRVLRNLLANAIRHTHADGTVEVAAAAEEGKACLAVADSCGGIPAKDLPRVFEVGFRGQAARTPGGDGGAGLGLAIARGIVEAHKGEITVGNRANGCRFVIRLPLATR